MEYQVNESAEHVTISFTGKLTFADAPKFEAVLSHLNKPSISVAAFDLSGLDFVDSTGMSLFIHAYDAAKAHDFKVEIQGARDKVQGALKKAGFDNLLSLG